MISPSDQFNRLQIEADVDFTATPDATVGDALKQLTCSAHTGIMAVVTMGLICIWAKGQLKHGEIGPWRESVESWGLSPASLYRYEAASRRFLKLQEDELEYGVAQEDARKLFGAVKEWAIAGVLANAILSKKPTKRDIQHTSWVQAFLVGKKRTQLYFHSNNPATLTADEEEAREKCEQHFLDHPEDDDYFRPLIENEDYTWCKAWKGIQGKLASSDAEEETGGVKRRLDPNYKILLPRVLTTLRTAFRGGYWDGLPADAKDKCFDMFREAWEAMPPELRTNLMNSTKKGASK